MNPLNLILLTSAVANLALAVLVLWRRHSSPLHFVFAFLVFVISLWITSIFLVFGLSDEMLVTVFGRMAFALAAVIAVAYLCFTWLFPERYHVRASRPVMIGAVVIAAGVTVLAATPLVQQGIEFLPQGKRPVFGPLHPVYVVYILTFFGWGTLNLIHSLLITPDGRDRMQLKYSLSGAILTILPAFLAHFVMPFVTRNTDWLILGGAAPFLWAVMNYYAIFKYRLMDIVIALRTFSIHAIMASVLTVFFFGPLILYPSLLQHAPLHLQALLCLILAVCLAVTVSPLHRQVVKFVDTRLFPGYHDTQTALMRFQDDLSRIYGRESLSTYTARQTPVILQATGASVYLSDRYDTYTLVGASDNNTIDRPPVLPRTNELQRDLQAHDEPFLFEEIRYSQKQHGSGRAILNAMKKLHAAVIAPLTVKGRVLGVLFLEERQDGDIYTSADLKLLGTLTSQVAIALDNTRLYEEIIASQRHYRTILQHMQRGVLAVDCKGAVVTINEAAAEILQIDPGEWVKVPVQKLVPEFHPILDATLNRRQQADNTEIPISVGGAAIPCGYETSQLLDSKGELTGALIVFEDLREKKRLEEEVRRIDRLASVGTLAAGMAHEIKNPLVSIQTFAQLLPERYEERTFREKFGNVVVSEVTRINKLVQSLLDFARPRPRKVDYLNVADILERALTLLDNELSKNSVQVKREYAAQLPQVFGDSEHLYQVFLNLLQNAVQAMRGPIRTLTISATEEAADDGEGHALVIRISDTGAGIDEHDLARIFDPFYSTKEDGSGLGLAICHGILEEHDATIDADSVPGEGTTFTLTLPTAGVESGLANAMQQV